MTGVVIFPCYFGYTVYLFLSVDSSTKVKRETTHTHPAIREEYVFGWRVTLDDGDLNAGKEREEKKSPVAWQGKVTQAWKPSDRLNSIKNTARKSWKR